MATGLPTMLERPRALQRRLRFVEKPQDAERRAGPQSLPAGEERARVQGPEAVHVLGGRQLVEDGVGIDLLGQRELHQHAVHRRIGVQLRDQREQLRLRGGLGQDVLESGHAGLGAGLRLAADVHLGRGVVAHADQRQARLHARPRLDLPHLRGHLGAHPRCDGLAVDDHDRAI
jgi:hypothetical protein